MAKKKKKEPWKPPFAPWMQKCFGRRYPYRPAGVSDETCPCPPTCRTLCRRVVLTPGGSPRVDRYYSTGRPFTPVWNILFKVWARGEDAERNPSDAVKLTYLMLVSYSRSEDFRWVYAKFKTLAEARGITERAFGEHVRWLEENELVLRIRRRDLDSDTDTPNYTLMLLDLPTWFEGWDAFATATRDRRAAMPRDPDEPEEEEQPGEFD